VLEVGESTEAITVNEAAVHAKRLTRNWGSDLWYENVAVPLNGRSFTTCFPCRLELRRLRRSLRTLSRMSRERSFSLWNLNPGRFQSTAKGNSRMLHHQWERHRGDVNAGTAIVPNLDSIAEFRILTATRCGIRRLYSGHINSLPSRGLTIFT